MQQEQAHRLRELWATLAVVVLTLSEAAVTASVHPLQQQPSPPACSDPVPCPAKCPAPRVKVESGELLGLCRPASPTKGIPQYAAFLGVPYAKPPLGELRFKAPRPVEPWSGVREAVLFGRKCIQDDMKTVALGVYVSATEAEDCLHVNVYSPWLQRAHEMDKGLLPVIVHVHGGAFREGTGNIIRPDYFIAKDLVVVTFNYRLGPMGFFSLDNDVAPGNAGLKDMVAALRWINRNVHVFGGDPGKVTLQGCSAGAAAVHWLTLLPDTEGLFRSAIIKSGSAMLPSAFEEHSHLHLSSTAMASLRKASPNHTDAQLLLETSIVDLKTTFMLAVAAQPKNAPVPHIAPERRADGGEEPKLVVKDAEAYILQPTQPTLPTRTRVPIIMGITSCEVDSRGRMELRQGLVPPIDSPELEAYVQGSVIPTDFAKEALGINVTTYPYSFADVADDLRHRLFNLTKYNTTCDFTCRWEKFASVRLVTGDTARSIRLHTREEKVPVYAYYYDYTIDRDAPNWNAYSTRCASHAVDDKRLWPEDEVDVLPLNTTHPLSLNVLRQVTLFSNFVKFGKPVPETDDTILPVQWTPMVKGDPDAFLRIGESLTMDKGDLLGEFGPFWTWVYGKYRGGGDGIDGI